MDRVTFGTQNISKILYLTSDDTKSLGFSDYDFYNCVSDIFVQLGQGEARVFHVDGLGIYPEGPFRFVLGSVARNDTSGAKWSAGFVPQSKARFRNNCGVIILNDNATGLPKAFLDSYYISLRARAASCAVYAKHFARNNVETVSIIGLGEQSIYNLYAMQMVLENIVEVRLYDFDTQGVKKFAQDLAEKCFVKITVCRTLEEALADADVVMLTPELLRGKLPVWYLPLKGSLIITSRIDVLEYKILNRMDKIIADELPEQEMPVAMYALQGEVSAKFKSGRENAEENILVVSNGLIVQEIYIGGKMYELALEKGIGTELDPFTW